MLDASQRGRGPLSTPRIGNTKPVVQVNKAVPRRYSKSAYPTNLLSHLQSDKSFFNSSPPISDSSFQERQDVETIAQINPFS